jgi:hypothetical protein
VQKPTIGFLSGQAFMEAAYAVSFLGEFTADTAPVTSLTIELPSQPVCPVRQGFHLGFDGQNMGLQFGDVAL